YTEEAPQRADTHAAGLFVPARHARRALQRMLGAPQAEWPWIGLLLDDPLLAASEGKAWDRSAGARVRRVFSGGPAAEAGLRVGDRVLSVGARATGDGFEALDAVLDLTIGEKTTITVERDARPLRLPIVAAERPPDPRPEPLDDF